MGYNKAEQIIKNEIYKLRSKAKQKQREADKFNADAYQLQIELDRNS